MDMRILTQSLLIYRLTGSVAILGIMSLFNALPNILLSLFGGVIADRLPKKHVIILGQAGAVFSSLIIVISLALGFLSAERAGSWWLIIAASFINASAFGLTTPSRQAIIAELVGTEQVMNAVSLRSIGYNIIHLGAPAIAGVLIDALGFEFVYYLMSSLSFISLVFALFLPLTSSREEKSGGVFSQLKDGLKYTLGEANILFVLAFIMMTALFATPYLRLLPVFVDDILKIGATGMGILLSASAIGAVVGSLILASLPSKRRGAMLLIAAIVLGLAVTVFAFSLNWYLSLAFIVLAGPGRTAQTTLSNTLLQSYTDSSYRGRVMSLYSMELGISNLGAFGAALLAGVIGVSLTVGGFALTLVLLSLVAMVFLPRIRKLD